MNKRAVIYARVSTDEQAEHGYSLQGQVEAMREYAAAHQLTVIAEFREDCTGTMLERPELDQVRMMITKREVEVVIVYSPDRLSRKLAHLLLLREELLRADIELHYVNRGKSEDTPEGRMTENIEGVFAEYWREKIIQNSRNGRISKAKSGKWVGTGPAPYGYKRVGNGSGVHLAVHKPEAQVMQRIFALYVGTQGKLPVAAGRIAEMLMEEGVPPPGRGPGPGRGWYLRTVLRLLSQTIYMGKYHHYGHTVDLPELAIVTEEVWHQAQKRRQRNRERASRNQRHEYLLSSHVYCMCGHCMSGYTKNYKRKTPGRYYRCNFRSSDPHLADCTVSQVRADIAESLVWNWISDLLGDEARLRQGLRRVRERKTAELAPKQERLQTISELIERTERRIRRIVTQIVNAETDIMVEALTTERKAAEREFKALAAEREALATELEKGEMTSEEEEAVIIKAAEMITAMANADFETKRYFFDRLDVRVQLRQESGERWLDCTWGIEINTTRLPIVIDKRSSPSS